MSNCRYCDDGMLPEKGLHEVEVYKDDPLVFMPCTAAKPTDEDVARLVDAVQYQLSYMSPLSTLELHQMRMIQSGLRKALSPFVEDEDEVD